MTAKEFRWWFDWGTQGLFLVAGLIALFRGNRFEGMTMFGISLIFAKLYGDKP